MNAAYDGDDEAVDGQQSCVVWNFDNNCETIEKSTERCTKSVEKYTEKYTEKSTGKCSISDKSTVKCSFNATANEIGPEGFDPGDGRQYLPDLYGVHAVPNARSEAETVTNYPEIGFRDNPERDPKVDGLQLQA